MKLKNSILALTLVFGINIANAANQAQSLNGFDFNYSVDLNKSIGLMQVFDDGDRTYFQFTQAENLPAIHVIKNGKKQAVALEVRPPYLITAGIASKYMLSTGAKNSIYVSYNGSRAESNSQNNNADMTDGAESFEKEDVVAASKEVKLARPAKTPRAVIAPQNKTEADADEQNKSQGLVTGTLLNIPFFENSIALSKKAKSDLSQRANEITNSPRVVVRGRPSVKGDSGVANTRALAIKNYLVDIMGVDESIIVITQEDNVKRGKNQGFYLSDLILLSGQAKPSVKTALTTVAVAPKKINTALNIKTGDLISEQLAIWAKKQGYSLEWEATEYTASAPLSLNKDFNGTLEAVIDAMKINGINLDATFYANPVIRITETK